MQKCDYKNCMEKATTKGYIYGHVTGSDDKDSLLPVNACDKHKLNDSFYEDSDSHNKIYNGGHFKMTKQLIEEQITEILNNQERLLLAVNALNVKVDIIAEELEIDIYGIIDEAIENELLIREIEYAFEEEEMEYAFEEEEEIEEEIEEEKTSEQELELLKKEAVNLISQLVTNNQLPVKANDTIIGYNYVPFRNELKIKFDKGTTVVLLMNGHGKIVKKGIAKTSNKDNFYEQIGAVIAIHRLFDLPVPEKFLTINE